MMFGNNYNNNLNPYTQQMPPGGMLPQQGLGMGLPANPSMKSMIIAAMTQSGERHTVTTLLAMLERHEESARKHESDLAALRVKADRDKRKVQTEKWNDIEGVIKRAKGVNCILREIARHWGLDDSGTRQDLQARLENSRMARVQKEIDESKPDGYDHRGRSSPWG